MLNGHVLPLEARATALAEHRARHDKRIDVHDTQIKTLRGQ